MRSSIASAPAKTTDRRILFANADSDRSLTQSNAAVLRVDHETTLVVGSRIPSPKSLARHTAGRVRATSDHIVSIRDFADC